MKYRVLVLGHTGQLGSAILKKAHELEIATLTIPRTKVIRLITNAPKFRKFLDENKVVCIINCLAFTDVLGAEKNHKEAFHLNQFIPASLEKALKISDNILLIHFSTDYVFDGMKATSYVENDEPNPLNVYGASKLGGETALLNSSYVSCLIFRIAGLFSASKGNFLSSIAAKLRAGVQPTVVDDQIITPISADRVADIILNHVFLTSEFTSSSRVCTDKLFHLVSDTRLSWYDFACLIYDSIYEGKLGKLRPIPVTSNIGANIVQRPAFSALSNERLKKEFCAGPIDLKEDIFLRLLEKYTYERDNFSGWSRYEITSNHD